MWEDVWQGKPLSFRISIYNQSCSLGFLRTLPAPKEDKEAVRKTEAEEHLCEKKNLKSSLRRDERRVWWYSALVKTW